MAKATGKAGKGGPAAARKPIIRRVSFVMVQKLLAAVALLAFGVVVVAGLMAGASLFSITWRACLVMLILKIVAVVVIRVLATYEELHGGQT